MRPDKLGVTELFDRDRRYVVPLYQRPYVWTEEAQWAPLWQDIRERAEAELLEQDSGTPRGKAYPHFLGAIVINQTSVFGRQVPAHAFGRNTRTPPLIVQSAVLVSAR
jgi:uncharacterized protein with ParB-like and HNH nuclease domain